MSILNNIKINKNIINIVRIYLLPSPLSIKKYKERCHLELLRYTTSLFWSLNNDCSHYKVTTFQFPNNKISKIYWVIEKKPHTFTFNL